MHYLLFSARETYPSIVLTTPLDTLEWVTGSRFAQAPPALNYEFEADADFAWPDYLRPNSVIPLFSPLMREVLEQTGVSNIDYYPACVTNLTTKESRIYNAANIIGILPAMDREKSQFDPARRHPVVVRSIDRLVIDEGACANIPLFRLAEYDLLVVIDERVAHQLGGASLRGVVVVVPEDWDGFTD
ncbi:MAG: hypothetical protein HGA75_07095 [Thiobacillus sp.]|nr:hypothetical protein [Thiobacillus sp.]